MPKIRGYKRAENNAIRSIWKFFKTFALKIWDAIVFIFKGGSRKLTIVVVPHSQKKVLNFQTTLFSLIMFTSIFIGIVVSFFWFSKHSLLAKQNLTHLQAESHEARASLDRLKDETGSLIKAAQNFQSAFSGTLSIIGLDATESSTKNNIHSGDLTSLFNIQNSAIGSVKEIAELQKLTSYLENSIQPIEEIGKLLDSQSNLFSDIPNLWPIKGGIGHISMVFGQNRHPLTGQWYIHKGVDLSTYRSGDPIVSTADGQVVTVDFDPGFGNYVIIKHKHGFYTRYAHMQSFRVSKGQYVEQGQIIGYIGNTGISTGPHVHYEVHIGSDVVDPMKYLNIRSISK